MNRVTAATFVLVNDSGDVLLQLRDEHSKRYPNTWCFPGGTVEPGERELDTVIREVWEEYELHVAPEDCSELLTHDLSYGVSAKVFVCRVRGNQEAKLHEGAAMAWMPLERAEMLHLGFEQNVFLSQLRTALNK